MAHSGADSAEKHDPENTTRRICTLQYAACAYLRGCAGQTHMHLQHGQAATTRAAKATQKREDPGRCDGIRMLRRLHPIPHQHTEASMHTSCNHCAAVPPGEAANLNRQQAPSNWAHWHSMTQLPPKPSQQHHYMLHSAAEHRQAGGLAPWKSTRSSA